MMNEGTIDELLNKLVDVIESVKTAHQLPVAVDGPPAGGKTTLADELALVMGTRGIRASVDGFLWPRAQRYRRGVYSSEGCYYDSFDYDTLYRVLLDPLGPSGDAKYQASIYERATDSVRSPPAMTAPADAVLLFDGVFLLRPVLTDCWDLRIYVSATFEQTLERARSRDQARLGSTAEIERYFRERYMPSQELYTAEAHPTERADIIVYNDVPERPGWVVRVH